MKSSTNYNIQKLSEIAGVILDPVDEYIKLKGVLDDLKELFVKVSGLDMDAMENSEDLYLTTGKAIGTKWAATCIEDLLRTKRFIRGIDKAVKDKQRDNNNRPVTILYAGTGPFATLVMPLTTRFAPSELQFIFLEVNPNSVEHLEKVIAGFNAEAYVQAIHLCDASQFELPSGTEVDILLIECLQQALDKEPQVAITYNLLPQLGADVVLIPKEISLHIGLIDSEKHRDYLMHNSETVIVDLVKNSEAVFTLNKEEVLKTSDVYKGPDFIFPKVDVWFTETQCEQKSIIAVNTNIIIVDTEKLEFNDCGLTIPFLLNMLNHKETIQGMSTQYVLGEIPSIKVVAI